MNGQPITPIIIFLFFLVAWLIFFIVSNDQIDIKEDLSENTQYKSIDSLFDDDLSSMPSSVQIEEPKPVVGRIKNYNWRKWPWYSVGVYVLLAVVTAILVLISIRLS